LFYTKTDSSHWGYTYMTLGGVVFIFAIINLLCLIEYPRSLGIAIKEEGALLNPNRMSVKKYARC